MKKIVIIDYEGSNLFSVLRAFEHVNVQVELSNSVSALENADAAVLPGVGAFGAAMERLNKLGLSEQIRKHVAADKPFLGICLGMQLLFAVSQEFGKQTGIGIFKGNVKRFPSTDPAGNRVRVPQMGWNQIFRPKHNQSWEDSPLTEQTDGAFMYFVHSFYCAPDDPSIITSETEYAGLRYCSSIKSGNLFAAQFHPEKSAESGLKIYQSWARQAGLI